MKLHEIKNEEILINRMYFGDYPVNFQNIGHEIINLLKADGLVDENGDKQNYIYVQPRGTIKTEHNNKIDTIVLTRNTCVSNALEVLAQAWELEQVAKIENFTYEKEIENILKKQTDYIKKNNITYKDKPLNEIYSNNEVCISFKANKLRRPKKPIFFYFGKNDSEELNVLKEKGIIVYLDAQNIEFIDESDNKIETTSFAKSSLKMYIKKGASAFRILQKILEDASFWENKNTTQDALDVLFYYSHSSANFIDLIDKQNDEITYSNLFKYIFESNKELFNKFAKDVLGIDNMSKNYKIKKGENNIDLLINDENNIIVIKNKINSGINGIKYDIYGNIIDSQSMKCRQYIEACEKNNKNMNKWYFIFAPDYNQINTKEIKFIPSAYKVIPYSKIYKFFDEMPYEIYIGYSNNIRYFSEFLYAIEKHINTIDNILEIKTHKKFIKEI